jgi:hypothetical protein
MQNPIDAISQASRRETWNKGKLVGAKPPFRPKHVLSIRNQAANRGADAPLGNVQSRHR